MSSHPSTIATEAARAAILAGARTLPTSANIPALEAAYDAAVEARHAAERTFVEASNEARDEYRARLGPLRDALVAAQEAEEVASVALAGERRRIRPPGSSMKFSAYAQALSEQREASPYADGRPIEPGVGRW